MALLQKNLEDFEALPEIFKNEVVFIEAIEKAELAKMNDEDRARYEYDLKIYRNNFANINTAKEEGIEIGEANKEKYADEKVKEEKMEIAKNCLKNGMSIEMTVKLTGLTENEIRSMGV